MTPLDPHPDEHLRDLDVPNRIRKLRDFLGGAPVSKALRQYRLSLQSDPGLYAEYYLKRRHPWWEAWTQYEAWEASGKAIRSGLSEEIKRLGRDAHMVAILQRKMPDAVRKKFKSSLLTGQAASHFFEIETAWAFYANSFEIEWNASTDSTGGEFAVVKNGNRLNVECKAVTCDLARAIKRSDFYRLLDQLAPAIAARSLTGQVHAVLDAQLPHDLMGLRTIKEELLSVMTAGTGFATCSFGGVGWELSVSDGKPVDLASLYVDMWRQKPPDADGAVMVPANDGKPADPVIITFLSKKATGVLSEIRNRLADAGRRQLPNDQPGMITCRIPEIWSFDELGGASGLTLMVQSLFRSDNFKHVVAVVFSSEPRVKPITFGHKFDIPALVYRNRETMFPASIAHVEETLQLKGPATGASQDGFPPC